MNCIIRAKIITFLEFRKLWKNWHKKMKHHELLIAPKTDEANKGTFFSATFLILALIIYCHIPFTPFHIFGLAS